jgi:hypothetical protein
MPASTVICERIKSAQLICWRRFGAGVWSKYWNGFCFQALAGAGRDWADEREWGRNATLQDEEIVP